MNDHSFLRINSEQLLFVLEDLMSTSRDVAWFWSPEERKIRYDSSLTEKSGYDPVEMGDIDAFLSKVYFADRVKVRQIGSHVLIPGNHPAAVEHRILCANGDVRWVRTSFRRIHPKWCSSQLVVGTITDIDAEVRGRALLREQNYRDPLTGLQTRVMLDYKLQAYMESVRRNGRLLALIELDLEGFKEVNESFGHMVGDAVLRMIGDVLMVELPLDATVFRVGGDEFAILVKNLENQADIEQIMQNVMKALSRSIVLDNRHVMIRATAGITLFPGFGTTSDEIQVEAGIALREAKETNPGGWGYFTPDLQADQVRRAQMEKKLRRAIRDREFRLVFQPQVDTETKRINGLEALIRWDDPECGPISPATFIPIAETCGLMPVIGSWVVETACAHVVEWMSLGAPPVRVSVNISPQQFKETDFLPSLRRTLSITGLDPKMLELEITESMFLEDPDRLRDMFEKIRSLGVQIALDDFGTGYSSLNYIKNYKLDRLKIDRSFIHDMKAPSVETAITGTIVVLAHILGLEVVAEGVETPEQYLYLREVGCNTIQGFYFSRPVESVGIPALLIEGNMMMKGAKSNA